MDNLYQLAVELCNSDSPKSVAQLSSRLGISEKSVRIMMDQLGSCLPAELTLLRKQGVGSWVIGEKAQKDAFLQTLMDRKKDNRYSAKMRQTWICKMLLMENRPVSVDELMKGLFTNRSTIYKDLSESRGFLERFGLKITSRKNCGVLVEGTEAQKREALATLLKRNWDQHEVDFSAEGLADSLNRQLSEILCGYVGKRDFDVIIQSVKQTEQELGYCLSDAAFEVLVQHIAIAVARIRRGIFVTCTQESYETAQKKREFDSIQRLVKRLEEALEIEFPLSELGYLTAHILSASAAPNEYQYFVNTNDNQLFDSAVREFLKEVGRVLNRERLQEDQILIRGLCLHLKPAIDRICFGLQKENEMLGEIKQHYHKEFGAVWASSHVLEEAFQVDFQEDEIGLLTLHIAAALEREKRKKNVVVVCHSGVGTSSILRARLIQYEKEINILAVLSSHQLEEYDCSNVDFIISTVSVKAPGIPVLKVKCFIDEADQKKLREFLNSGR